MDYRINGIDVVDLAGVAELCRVSVRQARHLMRQHAIAAHAEIGGARVWRVAIIRQFAAISRPRGRKASAA